MRLIEALNGKEFNELNNNLQQLIKDSFSNYQGNIMLINEKERKFKWIIVTYVVKSLMMKM